MPSSPTPALGPAPSDPDKPPQAKPNTPGPRDEPPGIAATIVKQQGQGPGGPDTAARFRREEEIADLDNLPSAAAALKPKGKEDAPDGA